MLKQSEQCVIGQASIESKIYFENQMSIEQHGVYRVQFTLQHAVCSMQSTGAVYSMQSTGVLYNPGKSEKKL